MVMAKAGWLCGSSLTIGRTFITSFKTTVSFRNPRFLFSTTHRCCRGVLSKAKGNLSSPWSVVVTESISLTDTEKQLFDQLLQVVCHYSLETQLRVAGGWVRDKLLGKECYDIDIALDNMLGTEFCEKVNGYLVSTGGKPQGIGVIHSKPDQSKHLETARMRLFDVWVDFVNLRSEDYAENSGNSTVEFGSAEQDAYRRDLTINSLFYNINTRSVEDFTGRGLDDLKSGKIATPLPPKVTFLDDPLRVLRAIRFSTVFDFEMVKDLKVAAADTDVKSAVADRISRERIGNEIDLMVSGNQPVKAMDYMSEFELFWVVFTLPPNIKHEIKEHETICVNYINAAWRLMNALGGCSFSDEQRRLYLYAALFLPLRKTVHGENKRKIISTVNHIFKNSLKRKASDAKNVIKLHNAAEKFLSLIPHMISSEDMKPVEVDWNSNMIEVPDPLRLRVLPGLILREIKDFWRAALMLTVLIDEDYTDESSVDKVGMFKKVEEEILKLGLEKVWEVEPLISGRDMMTLLELKNGGPIVSEWQQKLIQWQLAYPTGNVQECIDWMIHS
ncbi:putative CCA tRNA nucleotidyltransferase [Helianthus annuus]|uniref:CCA tRNA nucleotidyltransferase n=1 Tax=Helianthus annuus TaxID=4232 RepID=A0A251SJP8_HELAN|nr:tRNA nucleotidyltransferase cca2 [Helianthus annuus]KAF5769697.1 putative CCA tRNA nucleotidyltransferase [Helianthus annuus]KAJ0464669.1 putative CCA tRNA nucleotidyltransferase [Helianthus annuus]KAJ0486266.1 putative CCA tRNA nucleotidyltransferase [Helianthus annuus]KAJ0656818.1 putative CCA tRNA nucleotidyltransferase [Helianthus annuus]KAJ0660414.1 putative CCA tRNA nucleotidyltransferase [Helianthus annuus]